MLSPLPLSKAAVNESGEIAKNRILILFHEAQRAQNGHGSAAQSDDNAQYESRHRYSFFQWYHLSKYYNANNMVWEVLKAMAPAFRAGTMRSRSFKEAEITESETATAAASEPTAPTPAPARVAAHF